MSNEAIIKNYLQMIFEFLLFFQDFLPLHFCRYTNSLLLNFTNKVLLAIGTTHEALSKLS